MHLQLFSLLIFSGSLCLANGLNLTLEVMDAEGNLQSVQLAADMEHSTLSVPSLFMPHVVFPNGTTALISGDSDLDAVICEKLTGAPVFNPYRDLRITIGELLSYRRGIFSGTYSVRGNIQEGYYEDEISDSDSTIRLLSCSTY